MGNKWNDNWLEDARDVGLTTLGKAGLIGVALGTLAFGAYAAYKGGRAALDGETAFSGKISARLLSYGVACEYLLSGGRYAEAAVREEKFRAALSAAGLARRKLCVSAR